MSLWTCSHWNAIDAMTDTQRQECWDEFADTFNLHTADDTSVGDLTSKRHSKDILFRPDCDAHEPKGTTGGENFGVLARIPVLVQ